MITEEQLRNWERGAAEVQPISTDITRIGDTWHAPIHASTEYTLTTIDFANDAREMVPALIAEVRRLQTADASIAVALINGTVAGVLASIDVWLAPPMFWMSGLPVQRADGSVVRAGPAHSRVVITRISQIPLPQCCALQVLLFMPDATYSAIGMVESDVAGIVTMGCGAPEKRTATPQTRTDAPPDPHLGSRPPQSSE